MSYSRDGYPKDYETLEIGEHRIAYRRLGSGPDLLLIHGWPLNSATWRNIAPTLAERFTCHLIDLPGAGSTTTTSTASLRFEDNANVIEAVIDRLGLDRYALAGQDSGGMFARQVAARRPEQVFALAVMGTEIPGHTPWQVKVLKATGRMPGSTKTFATIVNNKWLRRAPFALGGCFADMSVCDGEFTDVMLAPFNDPDYAKPQIELLAGFDLKHFDVLFDVHPLITAPTLMVWGEQDPFFPVDKARAMAAEIAGEVTFEVIPDAKLFVHEEHPRRVADLMGDFFDKKLADAG